MDGGRKVWAPHPVDGYQLGTIVDVGTHTLTVEPLSAPKKVMLTTRSFVLFKVVTRFVVKLQYKASSVV